MAKKSKHKLKDAKRSATRIVKTIADGIKSYPEVRKDHVTTIVDLLAAACALGIMIISIIATT